MTVPYRDSSKTFIWMRWGSLAPYGHARFLSLESYDTKNEQFYELFISTIAR